MEDDMISRQAAIEAMMKLQTEDVEAYGASIPEGFDGDRAVAAIKALPSAQPGCEDAVYRKAVQMLLAYFVPEERYAEAVDGLRRLPSAQPGWIPLAVKYPETNEDVLLQFPSNQGVGFYENGSWGINTGDGIYSAIGDGEEMPMAWMPLPEPWEGEPNE